MTVTLALRCPRYILRVCVCILRLYVCLLHEDEVERAEWSSENNTAILLPEADDSLRKTLNHRLSFSRLFLAHHNRLSCHLHLAISVGDFSLLGKNLLSSYISAENHS